MLHTSVKILEGGSVKRVKDSLFSVWDHTGKLKNIRLISYSTTSFAGVWRFDVISNGVYLPFGKLTLTPADADDEKTGLSIDVVKGQPMRVSLASKGIGEITGPIAVIYDVEDGLPPSVAGEYTFPATDGTAGQVPTTDGDGNVTWETPSGGGIDGPGSSVDGYVAAWVGTGGDELGAGYLLDTDGTLASNSDTRIPSQKAVKKYVDDNAGGGSPDWGDIGGTLSAQTDLQSALNGKQASDSDLTAIAGLSASNDDVIQRKAGAWTNRTMAQVKTDLVLVKADVGLGNVDNTSDSTKNSATATLTNKRITARIGTTASSSTPTPDADAHDEYHVTALAATATFGAPSGTPTEGQPLIIRIKDNGTARGLSFNSIYRAIGVTLPTTTVISKTMYLGMLWNGADSKWDVLAVNQEA